MRVCNLDTAADERPSHFQTEMARMMRELPTPLHVARASVKRTRAGNLIEAR